MSEYTRYTVEDSDGNDYGAVWEQSEYADAKTYAMQVHGKVIAQEYTWEDSEVVEDYTPKRRCDVCDDPIEEGEKSVTEGDRLIRHKVCPLDEEEGE